MNPATAAEVDEELCRFQRAFERLSPKKREVYLLTSAESDNTDQMAIRMPASSRAVPVLEAMRLRSN